MLTQHNDLSRTGQNLSETILTPATVSAGNFGKIFSLTVDGVVEAQPLYVPSLKVAGGTHNVVFIATEHDSVYAFDADTAGAPLWQASLLDTAHGAAPGATSVPDTASGCYIANGEYGISGTPVIDPVTATLYVSSTTYENFYPVARIHALDITSGNEKFGGPVVIAPAVPGTGAGSSNGTLTFNSAMQNQRPGLALVNGTVYVAFGAYCDLSNFHGWLLAYNAATLTQTSVFITSPNGIDSGIWMGAGAPSVDTENGLTRMFITTGNGTYSATTPYATNSMNYADDILRLDLSNGIKVADAFTPSNQAALETSDTDLGSSSPLILPDQGGPYPHLLVEASKGGAIYLVNRDNLGGYSTTSNNVVQEIDNQLGETFGLAYWNGNIYTWGSADMLKQYSLTNGVLSSAPIAMGQQMQASGLGSSPSISASGTSNGIVWSIDSSQSTQVVYAHSGASVATLWSSATNAARDSGGKSVKFQVPTVVNGKVYVGSLGQVLVYGLPDFSLSAASASVTLTQGQTATNAISISALYGFTGAVTFSASNLPAGVTASFSSTKTGSNVTFAATAGAAPGSYPLTLTGTSGTISHSVQLTLAVVVPADFSVASSPAALSLSAGTSGTSTLTITPTQTFNGNVNLSCSVAASLANVTCSVPAAVSGGSGSVTLTVTANAQAVVPNRFGFQRLILIVYGLAGVLLWSGGHLVSRKRRWRPLSIGGAALLLLCLAGCGGSNSFTSANSTSETGMVTVTASSGSLTHSTAVSVTIQ